MTRSSGSCVGLVLVVLGAAHFVVPQAFAPITRSLFPANTRAWTYRNGAAETAIGAALLTPQTRQGGWAGLGVYLALLGAQAVRTSLR